MPRHKPFTHALAALLVLSIVLVGGCTGGAIGVGPLTLGATPRTGTLLYADPGVTVTRSGKPLVYEPGMEVRSGDSIETADGQAMLDYDDGSAVMLNRTTRVQLGSITLFFGELFARIKSIAARGGGQVITDELSASVEGTEYGVRRKLPGGETAPGHVQVYVRNGHVRCAPGTRASWPPLTLTVNQTLEVAGYRTIPAARPVDAQALSRWADEAQRRLGKARPSQIEPSIDVPIGPGTAPKPPGRYEGSSSTSVGPMRSG